ncbi:alpha/beta hydrolase [Oceanobacillus iheyensis]|uniref:alpha/beta hydrolase n=1 Tax=Oceanobacillus iheyensis TaxID=182710 RepID=UPI00363D183A
MKKILKIIILALFLLILLSGLAFYYWTQQTYEPTSTLAKIVDEDEIIYYNDWLIFESKSEEQTKGGIILYPGARVEPEAYSYYGQELSKHGYLVAIPNVRFSLPILEVDKAEEIIDKYASLENWFIGGHSLGGVAAASYAIDHLDVITGVYFLGSFPSENINFSNSSVPILTLFADQDRLTTLDKIDGSSNLLSDNTVMKEIRGGNHSQFGVYGKQQGDGEATISVIEQQHIVIESILEWVNNE